MYDGYTFEVIAPIDGRYPDDHHYPPVPARRGAGRLLAPLLRADARSGAVDAPDPPGDGKIPQAADGELDEPIKLKQKLPKGEAYLETEAPKGQMGFMDHRRRLGDSLAGADPQQQLLQPSVLPELCRGVLVADVPAIVGSLDIVLGEIDR